MIKPLKSLLVVLVILLIAEVILSNQELTIDPYISAGRVRMFQRSSVLGLIYEYIPNSPGINSQGFRDVEHDIAKPAGKKRIVIIGDSVVYGEHIQDRESIFGAQLAKQLDSTEMNYEVILMGVGGYSMEQEMVLLDKALQYSPDIILWTYVLNDMSSSLYHDSFLLAKDFYDPPIATLAWVEERLFFVREKILASSNQCNSYEFHEFTHCVYWDYLITNIQTIEQKTKEANTKLIFTIFPIIPSQLSGEFGKNYPLSMLHNKLFSLFTRHSDHTIDILDAYAALPSKMLTTYWGDAVDIYHPSAYGHQVAAAYIFQELQNAGIISH